MDALEILLTILAAMAVIIAAAMIAVIVYITKILKDIQHVSSVVRKESDLIAADVERVRHEIVADGVKLRHVFALLISFAKRFIGKRLRRTK